MVGSGVRVLLVGGVETAFHQFERVVPPLEEQLEASGHDVRVGVGARAMTRDNLVDRDVVVSITTRGTLTETEQRSVLAAVREPLNDRGRPVHFIGLHGASCSFQASEAYFEMLGGRFVSHPPPGRFELRVEQPDHPLTSGIAPCSFEDEQYVIEAKSDFELLMSSVSPGLCTPCLWTKRYGLGIVVYCALGHDAEQLRHPVVRTLLHNAVEWCRACGIQALDSRS